MNLRIYVKGYGLLCFDRNMGTNLSNKYCPNLYDTDNKSALDTKKKKLFQEEQFKKQHKQLVI